MDSIVDDLMLKVEAVGTEVRQIGSFILQMVGSDSQEDFILRICTEPAFDYHSLCMN